jgi:hypothetical protein
VRNEFALWPDLEMGIQHWGAWKRIALASDVEWMSPGAVKQFPLAERDDAIAWAAG